MKMGNPQKSVNRESHYARLIRGVSHPIIDLNYTRVSGQPDFTLLKRIAYYLSGAERVSGLSF